MPDLPLIHLATRLGSFATACRRVSKHVTMSAAAVTCEECMQTWDYAEAVRRHEQRAAKARRECPRCSGAPGA